jgi:hypothetical protein
MNKQSYLFIQTLLIIIKEGIYGKRIRQDHGISKNRALRCNLCEDKGTKDGEKVMGLNTLASKTLKERSYYISQKSNENLGDLYYRPL